MQRRSGLVQLTSNALLEVFVPLLFVFPERIDPASVLSVEGYTALLAYAPSIRMI